MNEDREIITADAAPPAIGPYSHAIGFGALLFCSGSLPIDPSTGVLDAATLADETTRCLMNLQTICEAGDAELGNALRVTIYTTQLTGFAEINAAYAKFLGAAPPARVTVGVVDLPKGAHVEIDAIVARTK